MSQTFSKRQSFFKQALKDNVSQFALRHSASLDKMSGSACENCGRKFYNPDDPLSKPFGRLCTACYKFATMEKLI